nr:MAG TPA: hypothetical protein [Caudoviricetes sp.]
MIATFWRGTPDAINRLAYAHYSGVNLGRQPPIPSSVLPRTEE